MTLIRQSISLALGSTLLTFCAGAAIAQTAAPAASADDSSSLQEVVITAQKRTEKLEDVPVSAAVVGSDTITRNNVTDISDLNNLVPSVDLNGSYNGRVPMGMRGISSVSNEGQVGLSSGVAILVDGVPVPSDSIDGNQLEDIQNVEVLKGPQATLGGRTAAAGVINIVTKSPSDKPTGDINAVITSDHEYRLNGFVSGPLSNSVDYSLSAYGTTLDQPVRNLANGKYTNQEIEGVRGKLLFKPTDDLDITLVGHYGHMQSQGFNFAYTYLTPGANMLGAPPLTQAVLLPGITPNINNTNYASPVNSGSHTTDGDFSAIINYRLPGGFALGSTTAYQHEKQDNVQDLFAVDEYFWNVLTQGHAPPFYNFQEQTETVTQLSEEIKLVSPATDAFNYVIGVFYSDSKINEHETRGLLPAALDLTVIPDTKTTDIYARSNWKFLPSTTLVTGLRYNYDQVSDDYNQALYTINFPTDIQGPISNSESNSSSTVVGDISLQQQVAPNSMLYGTYARGYSPGAYNTAQPISVIPNVPAQVFAQKETINHFEIGSKGTYLNQHLTLNVSIWDTKYQNFQVQVLDTGPGLNTVNIPVVLANAGGAETRGLELDTNWAATNLLRLNLNYAYVDAKFTSYPGGPCYPGEGCNQTNLTGAVMPNAPKNKFILGAEQRLPLPSINYDMVFAGSYAYTAATQMLADQNPQAIRPAYGLLNLSVGLRSQSGKLSATLFVDNALNKHYVVDMEDFWNGLWGNTNTVISQPARDTYRYAGIRLSAGF